MSYTEMPEVVGVALNDIDVIVNAAGKVIVNEILRTRDDKVFGTAAAQMVTHREPMNNMHGIDHVADGRLAVPKYIHDAGNIHAAPNQETTKGKREWKLTEKGVQYQISLLEEKCQKLNAKLIRKSTETVDLLFSMKNKAAGEECMNQFNDVLDAFVTADKEYKRLKQMNEEDDEWFENIDYWVCSFKHKIYNWLRETRTEIHGDGKASCKSKSSKSCSVKTSSSSGSSRSVEAKEIEEKNKLAEFQGKMEFIKQ